MSLSTLRSDFLKKVVSLSCPSVCGTQKSRRWTSPELLQFATDTSVSDDDDHHPLPSHSKPQSCHLPVGRPTTCSATTCRDSQHEFVRLKCWYQFFLRSLSSPLYGHSLLASVLECWFHVITCNQQVFEEPSFSRLDFTPVCSVQRCSPRFLRDALDHYLLLCLPICLLKLRVTFSSPHASTSSCHALQGRYRL